MTSSWKVGAEHPALTRIAHTPELLVALDFDGTAAPLVSDPMAARAIPEVVAATAALAVLPHTHVAYVSGRSLVHLREITEQTDDSNVILAGSHGAEYWYPGGGEQDAEEDPATARLRADLFDEVGALLRAYPGVELERKTFGLGVHGRPAELAVEAAAFAAVDELMTQRAPSWRRRTGDRILEFASRHEGKDAALAALRARTGATGILFAGDDITDEDAMRTLGPADLGVKVGAGESAATLRVNGPRQIAELLSVIAAERGAGRE